MAKSLAKRRGTESTSQVFSEGSDVHPIERVVVNLLQYLNHSSNGVLYCIVGTRFRNELSNAEGTFLQKEHFWKEKIECFFV